VKTFTRITVDPNQMGGLPCIRGLRIPVATVFGMGGKGMAETEILDAYPNLEVEDIREALRYAAERPTKAANPISERERGQCGTNVGQNGLASRCWSQADSWLNGYDLILRLGDFC
jgi:uncharacterized protein (DUF433 family)